MGDQNMFGPIDVAVSGMNAFNRSKCNGIGVPVKPDIQHFQIFIFDPQQSLMFFPGSHMNIHASAKGLLFVMRADNHAIFGSAITGWKQVMIVNVPSLSVSGPLPTPSTRRIFGVPASGSQSGGL